MQSCDSCELSFRGSIVCIDWRQKWRWCDWQKKLSMKHDKYLFICLSNKTFDMVIAYFAAGFSTYSESSVRIFYNRGHFNICMRLIWLNDSVDCVKPFANIIAIQTIDPVQIWKIESNIGKIETSRWCQWNESKTICIEMNTMKSIHNPYSISQSHIIQRTIATTLSNTKLFKMSWISLQKHEYHIKSSLSNHFA